MATILKNISEEASHTIEKEWGIADLPPDKRDKAVRDLGLMLYQAMLVRSLDILSVKEQEALDELLEVDTTTTEEVLKFLKSKIPTFDLLLREEKEKIKEDVVISVA